MTESLLTVVVFLSLALTQFRNRHVRVVLLTRRLPVNLQRMAFVTASALGTAFFAWCAYAAWGFAMQSYAMNEQEWGAVRFPLYPVKFIVFAGVLLLAIQFLLNTLLGFRGTPDSGVIPESDEGL